MRVPVAVWQPCELLYTCYLLTYLLANLVGHARQRHEVGWRQNCSAPVDTLVWAHCSVRKELTFSSVQFVCRERGLIRTVS